MMRRVLPFYSKDIRAPQVYHDHPMCHLGRRIASWNCVAGTGNRHLCVNCLRLHNRDAS